MDKYILNKVRYGTHQLIAEEIGVNNLVLDIGCNRGYLRQIAGNNIFYGIDNDESVLKEANSNGYKKVYKQDLNTTKIIKLTSKFDVMVFGDVLEHLINPGKVLKFMVNNYLKKGGKVIISLPNVANFTVRLSLILGNFDYQESGILDRTHLHLYTLKTARLFLKDSGLEIVKEKFSSNRFGGIIRRFPGLGTILGFNLIFICRN